MRKWIVSILVIVSALLIPLPGRADVVATDSFEDVAAGSSLADANGGTGWSGSWALSDPYITAEAYAFGLPEYGPAGTQAAAFSAATQAQDLPELFHRTFPAQTGTLYLGMRLRLTSFDDDDFLQVSLNDGSPMTGDASLSAGVRNHTGNPFFARVGNHANTTNSALLAADDTDYFFVMKISKDAAGTYNRTDLFVNPSPLAEPSTSTATRVGPESGLGQVSIVNFRLYSVETDDLVRFDTLRIGTRYADVVPEPATAALLLLAAPVLIARRRRR